MVARALDRTGQDLAAKYLPLAARLARSAARSRPELADELVSAANLGLVEAARDFDPGRGSCFAAYARPRIMGRIVRTLRGRRSLCTRSLHWLDGADVPAREDRVPGQSGDPGVLLAGLPDRLAVLLRGVYFDGLSQPAAGARIGVRPTQAKRLHAQAIGMLV
jgi:RNA polymerase sigma factor (sigma-70 family)